MIPYNYRQLMKAGRFNDPVGMKIWLRHWPDVKAKVMASLRETVPIDVSPIAHILSGTKLPTVNLFPPWKHFYFELKSPYDPELRAVYEKAGGTLPERRTPDGVCVHVQTHEDLRVLAMKSGQKLPENMGSGWVYGVFGISYPQKGLAFVSHMSAFFIRTDGSLVMHPKSTKDRPRYILAIGLPEGLINKPGLLNQQQLRQGGQMDANVDCSSTIRFVSFMQARNIKAKRKHYPEYKARKKQRHKVYKYYELTVVKPAINEVNQPHGEGVKGKALHSVRGHIRHYSEEHPMFGTPGLSGAFFIAQHIRGDIKHGEVKKTYATKGRQ